eukprot:gene29011-5797_t
MAARRPVLQSLADHDPDVDAIYPPCTTRWCVVGVYRLTRALPHSFRADPAA